MLDWGGFFVRAHADKEDCKDVAGRNVPPYLITMSPQILPLLLDYRSPSSCRGACLLSREGGWLVTMRGLRLVESAWSHKEMRAVVDSVSIAAHRSECCRGCNGSEGQLVTVADEPKTHRMVEKRGVLHQNSPVDVSIRIQR